MHTLCYEICAPKHSIFCDNERNNDGSMHLIQCTGTSPYGKDCVVWTSVWLPKRISRNFMDRPFISGFCTASGYEERKTSPPSNADITNLFCADLNEQYGRRDNIAFLGLR